MTQDTLISASTASTPTTHAHDVIIIGSGAAGLTAALELAETKRVLVLAKGSLTGGSTAWAPVSYTHLTLPTICSV